MYSVSRLRTAFASFVSIEQANIPGIPTLVAPLTESSSGISVQSKHPLVTLENIYYAAPDFNPNNWNAWVSLQAYLSGATVNYAGAIYKALNNVSSATNPATDTTNWVLYNPFQVWNQKIYNQAVSNLFAEVVKRKKLGGLAKAIKEKMVLFNGGGSKNNLIVNDGSGVGFEITPQSAEGLLTIINAIGIQSSVAQTGDDGIRYYLYHSERNSAIASWRKDITNAYTFNWSDLTNGEATPSYNAIMQYLNENTIGKYFIMYYQDDLVGSALSKAFDCSNAPCYGCDGTNTALYNLWSEWVTMRSIKVPATSLKEDRTLFDVDNITYGIPTNWGLNMQITARCDLTNLIIYSMPLYADVFAMQLAKEYLCVIAMSSNINPTNNQIQVQARAQLDEKFPGSWIRQYNDSIEALNIDLSGFSKSCQPCTDKKRTMKWKVLS